MKSYFGTQSIVAAIFAALASASVCEAYFAANESSYLNFPIPHTMHHNVSWPHITSIFGRLGHGPEGSLVLPVKMFHNNHHLCNDNIDQKSVIDQFNLPADHGAPFVLLLERGLCTYVKKVRNAQHLGAAAVLIADTEHDHLPFASGDHEDILHLDSDPHPTPDDHNHTMHENELRLPDDGSGRDVSIPSMMIGKKEYEGLRKIIDSKPNSTGILVAEIKWQVPKFGWKVTMELWSSPVDRHTKEFLASNFSAIARSFDLNEMHGNTHDNESYNEKMNLMRFRELPILLDGMSLGCLGNTKAPDEDCYMLCTNGGRYCHASHRRTSGKDIVTESLRRMCIAKHYKSAKVYWDYIDHFNNYCWDSDYFAAEKCVDDAYKHSNIKKEEIESCFSDSGDPTQDNDNALLQYALDMSHMRGVYQSPTVMINHEHSPMISWQGLTPQTVLRSLCDTFAYGEKPHVCYACMQCGDPVACSKRSPMKCVAGDGDEKEDPDAHKEDNSDDKKKDKKHKNGTGHKVFRWFFGLFLVGGCFGAYVVYKKKTEEGGLGGYSLQEAFLSDSS